MLYHEEILYPSDAAELRSIVGERERDGNAKAVIIPHCYISYAKDLYRKALGELRKSSRIVLLCPIHSHRLDKDSSAFLFEAEPRIEKTGLGEIEIASLGLESGRNYEEEEFSAELIYPFLASYFPGSRVSVVFSDAVDAKETRSFSSFISSLDDGDTSFVISSNLSGYSDDGRKREKAEAAIEAILSGRRLLDEMRNGKLSICGGTAIEAVARAIGGRWILAGEDRDRNTAAFIRSEE